MDTSVWVVCGPCIQAMSGYVMQDDLLNAYLTVEETLWYAAELRLPRETSDKHRKYVGSAHMHDGWDRLLY